MNFIELATKRWSCRSYSDRPVEQEKIDTIIEAARLAPTAVNFQPVRVWVLKSPEALEKVRQTTRSYFGAPVVFLGGCQPEQAWVRRFDEHNGAEVDAGIIDTYLMNEATDLGLDTLWVGSFDPALVHALFPETVGYELVAQIHTGYAAADAVPSPRHAIRKSREDFAVEL